MLDLKLLRSDPERVKAALARRGAGNEVDELLALDARRRELLPRVEDAQAERNAASKRIGEIKREGGDATPPRSPRSAPCASRSTPAKRSSRRSSRRSAT